MIFFYRGRQTIENFFKESLDFEAGKMPSQKERANEAYLQLVTIAENCCLWHRDTIETLRDKLIHHGASVRFVDGICNLRLNASYRYKIELAEILDNLRQEVHIQRIASHKALRDFQF